MQGLSLFDMDEFKPICRRCGKSINWGQAMGESSGIGDRYWYHEYSQDCGIIDVWVNPADNKYNE